MQQRQPVHVPVLGVTGGRENLPTKDQLRALFRLTGLRRSVRRGKASPRFAGPALHLVHGAARGIDSAVAAWAKRWTPWMISPIPADWQGNRRFAGTLRNSLVVRSADLLVSFGGGTGTANCVRQALEHGTPVVDLSRLALPAKAPRG
jgi:SLOG cluster4 family